MCYFITASQPTVLLNGATGQIGDVLRRLPSDDSSTLVAAVRSAAKAAPLEAQGIRTVILAFDKEETLGPALQGIDRALLVTGYTVDMLRQSKVFLDQAKVAGVQHIVHLGACGRDDTTVAHWAWHQLVERYIEWSGFSFTHLRPEKHAGQTCRLGYDAKSYGEIAAIMQQALGEPFRYEALPPPIFLENMRAAGAEMAYMGCVYDHYKRYAAHTIPGADDTFDNFPTITGQEPVR